MSVQRKPKQHKNAIQSDKAEQFIANAGTTEKAPKAVKAKKVPVALRFNAELLEAIDNMATRRGMSRNAIISYWCSKGVESE
ncbi:MAG: hypothetical protein JKY25_09815 [Robiginitomaculum sp.]|nr:hypothetical protein [Robiginitomaculum sp.]